MRALFLAAALVSAALALPRAASAQSRPSDRPAPEDDSAKRKKDKEEWGDVQAPLPAMRNAGPCPFVKVLYDAGRYVEFKDGREASANVGYTGEIQGISAGCEYREAEPIRVRMEVLFELGKGPQAQGDSKTYSYWIAVTKRNDAIITRQSFDLPVKFEDGQDRVYAREQIAEILIPRASLTTNGGNFEILVGFDVTPQMAAFNREGKRFRVNAGAVASGTSAQRP